MLWSPVNRVRARAPIGLVRRAAAPLAIATLVWLPSAPLAAQTASQLSLARIHAGGDFEARGFTGTWMTDSEGWALTEEAEGGGTSLVRVEAATGARYVLVGAGELVPSGTSERLSVESFSFSADGRKVLLFTDSEQVWRARTRGKYWVFDLQARTLTPVSRASGGQMFAKLSPDALKVAFVRDHDLWLTDLVSGEERRLTNDGGEAIINGTTDWVYEEELGLRDAFRWSPDGSRIAYWQLDQSPVRKYYLIDETRLYPELTPIRYPKAGTENSTVRVGSVDLSTGRTTWFELDPNRAYYVARMEWAGNSDQVVIQTLNRHQNRLELLFGEAATGATRILLVEEDPAWVDVNDDFTWIDGGQRFLWTSERDGWRHVYLYERDGTLTRQLTRGEWDVDRLLGADAALGRFYFRAAYGRPSGRSVLSVDRRGTIRPLLHGERGTFDADFSPDHTRLVHTYSTIDRPPVVMLAENRDDEVIATRVLEDNADLVARLEGTGLVAPEFLTLSAADGTPLEGYIIKPRDFDPGRRYGLLLYVYGGPGSQTTADRWGGSRYVWHHYLAQRGVLVASVDNRGTGARGREFEKQTYLKLGQLETADQLAAASQLGALPYVDGRRIGIWGWSYGGYMTLLTTLRSRGAVAAGVSVAPVTDWKLYDTIYTERFMRTPQENAEGYERGAPLGYAAELDSPLLIVHGTGDDNVHSQNTTLMIEALENAGKQFDMRLYPNKRHGIAGGPTRVNLFGLITGFVLEHLGPEGAEAVHTSDG